MTKIIKYLLPCLFGLVLFGCATEEKYHAVLNGWVGTSERNLITEWGVPDGSYELSENEKLVVYKKSSLYVTSGSPPGRFGSSGDDADDGFSIGGIPPTIVNEYCATTFTLINGTVTDWKTQGNNCVAN